MYRAECSYGFNNLKQTNQGLTSIRLQISVCDTTQHRATDHIAITNNKIGLLLSYAILISNTGA